MQELIGGNWIFLVFLPYFAATALQDTHLRIGLIVGTVGSGIVLLLGLGAWALNLRKVFPHILEVLMFIIYIVQLGVSYGKSAYEQEVIRTYNFITHSALAGVCLLSMLACYPVGYQAAQELVHRLYMTAPEVHRVGLYTTAALTGSLVSSCLLYLAPLCKGFDDRHLNALNLAFRIIYPCLATALALVFVRFFPDCYLPNLAVVHGLNRKPPANLPGYLTDISSLKPPTILDPAMYQSTVDAATKAREAATMPRAGSRALALARTPQYAYAGSSGGAPGSPSLPPPPAPGVVVPPAHALGGGYTAGLYPRQDPQTALYTYYAAGPPAPPPLAVYAVYGDYEAYGQPYGAAPLELGQPNGRPLIAGQPRGFQPLPYGSASRVVPYTVQSAGGFGAAYTGGGDRRVSAAGPVLPPSPQIAPGRPYASTGGAAGPYAVNMPLQALAAGPDGRAGAAPPPAPPRNAGGVLVDPEVVLRPSEVVGPHSGVRRYQAALAVGPSRPAPFQEVPVLPVGSAAGGARGLQGPHSQMQQGPGMQPLPASYAAVAPAQQPQLGDRLMMGQPAAPLEPPVGPGSGGAAAGGMFGLDAELHEPPPARRVYSRAAVPSMAPGQSGLLAAQTGPVGGHAAYGLHAEVERSGF